MKIAVKPYLYDRPYSPIPIKSERCDYRQSRHLFLLGAFVCRVGAGPWRQSGTLDWITIYTLGATCQPGFDITSSHFPRREHIWSYLFKGPGFFLSFFGILTLSRMSLTLYITLILQFWIALASRTDLSARWNTDFVSVSGGRLQLDGR